MVDANVEIERIDRSDPRFGLAIGGYGLFGVISSVELRLTRRFKIQRRVEIRSCEGIIDAFEDRIQEGYEFGDFQFAIDPADDRFIREGVFACYRRLPNEAKFPPKQRRIPNGAWHKLAYFAHYEKTRAYELYRDFYSRTDGQVYWSDLHQMTPYLDHYHHRLDRKSRSSCPGSEMITELYVSRSNLEEFLNRARLALRRSEASVIYGTIRLVEKDVDTFLAWAREPWACVIFNLHVDHSEVGIKQAQSQFRELIDIALGLNGTFYLTYHRWATREQLLAGHPKLPEFIAAKHRHDPAGKFKSDWFQWLEETV